VTPSSAQKTEPVKIAPVPRWRRWGRRALVLVLLIVLVYLFRRPILRGLALPLVAEEADTLTPVVALWRGDRCHDHAAAHYHAGTIKTILLLEENPGRLQRLKLVPTRLEVERGALRERGVPRHAVEVLPGDSHGDWDRARQLQTWLETHPGDRVVLLCDRFNSRRTAYVLDATLGGDCRGRVQLLPLFNREYSEADWWTCKTGLLEFLSASVGLAYVAIRGEDARNNDSWDPDAYESQLK
jgi:hypothetical protein